MPIHQFADLSPPSYTLNYMDMIDLVRLNTTKVIEFSPYAENTKKNLKAALIEENK